MDEPVSVVTKHLADKQQQLFDKQGQLLDHKHYLAASGMQDGQEAKNSCGQSDASTSEHVI